MQIRISEDTDTILQYARDEAMRTGSLSIEADHLLLATLRHGENGACRALKALGVDLPDLKRYLDSCLFRPRMVPYARADEIVVSKIARGVIEAAAFEALKAGVNVLSPVHLLLSLSRSESCAGRNYLKEHGLGTDEISKCIGNEDISAEMAMNPQKAKNLPVAYLVMTSNNAKFKS